MKNSQGLEMELLARHWRELSTCCAVVMLRMSFSHGVVVTGAGGALVPHLLGEQRPKAPPYLAL
jgi:hypothetical protein